MRYRGSTAARAALAGLGVLVLLGLVALGSRAGGGGGSGGSGPSHSLVSYAFTIVVVAVVLGVALALVWLAAQRERGSSDEAPRSHLLHSLLFCLLVIALVFAILRARQLDRNGPNLHLPPPPTAATATAPTAAGPAEQAPPSFEWPVVIAAAGAGIAILAAYLVRRRRRGALAGPHVAEEVSFALDEAIDDLADEADPRLAVIRAYARTEAVLAAHGLPRRPSEAPNEYLARALSALDASAASVARLTALFERARFSLHEIDEGMRAEALAALAAVRDELRGEESLAA